METSIKLTKLDSSQQLYVGTFGGEYRDEWGTYSEYGIQIDNVAVDGLNPDEFKKLAVLMINHLIVNGHSFELIANPNQDMSQELRSIN